MHSLLVAVVSVCVLTPVIAQRGDASIEWQKRVIAIDYGAVAVGKHTLDELQIGQSWRMGSNAATTCRTELPVLMGGRALPPGNYRLSMVRVDDDGCEVRFEGSRHVLGAVGDLALDGALGEAKKPNKQLEILWQKGKVEDKQHFVTDLSLVFGATSWHAPAKLVGGATQKVGAYQLTVFALPAAVVAARKEAQAPIGLLQRGSGKKADTWNVMLGDAEVRLVPWLELPTDNNGFGEIKAVPADQIVTGTLAAEAAADTAPEHAQAEVVAATLTKGTFTLQFAVGKEVLTANVQEPGKKK